MITMLYIYTKGGQGAVAFVMDDEGETPLEPGNDYEEREESVLKDYGDCGERYDPEFGCKCKEEEED